MLIFVKLSYNFDIILKFCVLIYVLHKRERGKRLVIRGIIYNKCVQTTILIPIPQYENIQKLVLSEKYRSKAEIVRLALSEFLAKPDVQNTIRDFDRMLEEERERGE